MGANAQTSVPAFTAGQVLTAQQQTEINTGVPVFADATARDAAFGGTGEKTLAEGQLAYLEDSNIVQYYDGSNWLTVGPSAPVGLVQLIAETAFTTASTITVNDVFSSTYTNYLILMRYATSGGQPINATFRVGGSNATSNYNSQRQIVDNTSQTIDRQLAQSSFVFAKDSGSISVFAYCVAEISGVNLASATNFAILNTTYNGAYNAPVQVNYRGNHSTATAYTGIEWTVAGGQNTTGNYAIYGYAK